MGTIHIAFCALILTRTTRTHETVNLDTTEDSHTSPFPSWLFPFWDGLAKAMDTSGNIFGGLSGVSIRPSVDTSKTTSVYVELLSVIPYFL